MCRGRRVACCMTYSSVSQRHNQLLFKPKIAICWQNFIWNRLAERCKRAPCARGFVSALEHSSDTYVRCDTVRRNRIFDLFFFSSTRRTPSFLGAFLFTAVVKCQTQLFKCSDKCSLSFFLSFNSVVPVEVNLPANLVLTQQTAHIQSETRKCQLCRSKFTHMFDVRQKIEPTHASCTNCLGLMRGWWDQLK